MTPGPRVLPSIAIPIGPDDFDRADIEVAGLDQAGPSFELRIFLDNPGADAATDPSPDAGYAGSIHVYGYGQPPPGLGDHQALPMTRYVTATDAVRAAAAAGPTAAVTLVAVTRETPGPEIDLDPLVVSVRIDAF